jgi:hypothetical protein
MTLRTPLLCVALAPTLLSCLLVGCKRDDGPVDMAEPTDLAVSDLGRPDLSARDLGPLPDLLTDLAATDLGADLAPARDLGGPTDLAVPPDLPVPGDLGGGTDLAVPPDLPVPGDLAVPGDLGVRTDLAVPADLATGADLLAPLCRGDGAPGTMRRLATSSLKLPTAATGFAIDLDGDGRTENQLKNIIGAISALGMDPQVQVDDAVRSGQLVYLLGLKTTSLDTSCAGLVMNRALPTAAPPAYDGSDVFTSALPMSAQFTAGVPMGQLGTTLPKDLKAADEATLPLSLALGPMVVTLPLRGVHVQGRLELTAGKLTIRDGQIHGAIAVTDLDRVVYPQLAATVTAMINGDPMSSTTRTLIGLFESATSPVSIAKCMVAKDCCKTSPSTCRILPEEVKDSVVGTLFSPDVEVISATDQWAPVRGGANKDAVSVGIGFSAVQASF